MSPPIAELPITGYLDRFSRRPGERFAVKVSVRDGGTARARLVRVISGDPNPDGPGLRFEDLSHRFDVSLRRPSPADPCGLHAVVPRAPRREGGACTWSALLWLAAQPDPATVRRCWRRPQDGVTVSLAFGADGLIGQLQRREWPGGGDDRATARAAAVASRLDQRGSRRPARRWWGCSRWMAERPWSPTAPSPGCACPMVAGASPSQRMARVRQVGI